MEKRQGKFFFFTLFFAVRCGLQSDHARAWSDITSAVCDFVYVTLQIISVDKLFM